MATAKKAAPAKRAASAKKAAPAKKAARRPAGKAPALSAAQLQSLVAALVQAAAAATAAARAAERAAKAAADRGRGSRKGAASRSAPGSKVGVVNPVLTKQENALRIDVEGGGTETFEQFFANAPAARVAVELPAGFDALSAEDKAAVLGFIERWSAYTVHVATCVSCPPEEEN